MCENSHSHSVAAEAQPEQNWKNKSATRSNVYLCR